MCFNPVFLGAGGALPFMLFPSFTPDSNELIHKLVVRIRCVLEQNNPIPPTHTQGRGIPEQCRIRCVHTEPPGAQTTKTSSGVTDWLHTNTETINRDVQGFRSFFMNTGDNLQYWYIGNIFYIIIILFLYYCRLSVIFQYSFILILGLP